MPRDHFVAKTYLKHFGDPRRGSMLRAYRKSDGMIFPCHPSDVCWEWDGDKNSEEFTSDPNLLGFFRSLFEPHWDDVVRGLSNEPLTQQDKLVCAGFIANLMMMTTAWRRISAKIADHQHSATLRFIDKMNRKHGKDDPILAEGVAMLDRGVISLESDRDWVKAKLTRRLMNAAWATYNQDWTVLHNDTGQPFLTSDNPAAMEVLPRGANRLVPITPNLCLLVQFQIGRSPPLSDVEPELDLRRPPIGRLFRTSATTQQVKTINKIVARCAEELVFTSQESAGVAELVRRNARFGLDVDFTANVNETENSLLAGYFVRIREMDRSPHPSALTNLDNERPNGS